MNFLLGLIGHPVSHSLSPPMHKAALSHYGLSGDYRLVDLPPELLKSGVERLVSEKFVGFNVTVPHKLKVMELVSELTGEARQLKAVNTVKISLSGVLTGHNTDLGGFMVALSDALPDGNNRQSALVVGAGGAARAAVWGLAHLGWRSISVAARNEVSALALVYEVSSAFPGHLKAPPQVTSCGAKGTFASGQYDLLVNCSPVGLQDDLVPPWIERLVPLLGGRGLLFDMVYRRNKEATPLVSLACSLDKSAVDGTAMLVHQAALAFNYWTGKAGPVEVMQNVLGL